ncbi:hypothetical protein [Saccharopolyspora gregorii]|uniref:Uncharacterized protein n=1 Tax=Saccharopolyspora gregorii TaxID=33914 RepID=A0ABP6RPP1_9PSEU|nr:hypothetical protein [Saccharopolyspora gregorii]
MGNNTSIESALYSAFDEVVESKVFEVDFQDIGSFSGGESGRPGMFDDLDEWRNVIIDDRMDAATPKVSELGLQWRTRYRRKHPEVLGEFRVRNLYRALLRPPPELVWSGSTEAEKDFVEQLRVIDDTPRSGAGLLTAIRIQEGVSPLEVWYFDKDLSRTTVGGGDFIRLNIDYSGYMKSLALTKGSFGWQYLFADISINNLSRDVVQNIDAMLRVFPNEFPGYEYRDLQSRLEART